ncbi:hypothetical protein GGE65_007231 [Skermanella aerolata]
MRCARGTFGMPVILFDGHHFSGSVDWIYCMLAPSPVLANATYGRQWMLNVSVFIATATD